MMNSRKISLLFKQIFIINLMLISLVVNGQQQISNSTFTVSVREEIGDLNGDGLADKVAIKMDTADITKPLQLEIFFQQKDSKYKLVASSTKLLAPQYNKDGKYAGNVLPDVVIDNGILNILTELNANHSQHQFKFQNENFELIHYFNVIWDGKNTTTETKFDLLTGNYSVESQQLGSDKLTVLEKKKIVVKPLPKLQNFVPFANQLY
ncbi:hypothetical protein [Chryseobacterium sp. FH1]|uniref:hypothetical protein n=1 Tax=Chryseobacterium sp. FH1 TaxID=1233951 RepID=UPI0004E351DF|nr:hypothetical protein [Chryseobacterium sp. FH1]KFC19455.1 hypothetical protein IO90_09165 [Chryseobacterium sp. FH1]